MPVTDVENLEYANKLIFVKEYLNAYNILGSIANSASEADQPLAHLRRIELAVRLEKTDQLLEEYRQGFHSGQLDPFLCQVCIDLIEQQLELVPVESSIGSFRTHIEQNPTSQLAYFGLASALESQGDLSHAIFNFEQCIRNDSNWYPAYFGLSQVYYQLEDDVKGDYYFYLFEKGAPYNLYGNFETHKLLSQEFLEQKKFGLAEIAMTTLSDWWYENKGYCPPEIQIFESLLLSTIARTKDSKEEEENHLLRADGIAVDALQNSSLSVNSSYFIARALDQFEHPNKAKDFYIKILSQPKIGSQMIQKIGSQLLASSSLNIAEEVFTSAYGNQPGNADIRFLKLIVDLKKNEVEIEGYLAKKEKLGKLIENQGSQVETLALIHDLLSEYHEDSEVRKAAAELYSYAGNHELAMQHYKEMYRLDSKNIKTTLVYAEYLLDCKQYEDLHLILEEIDRNQNSDHFDDIEWIKARLLHHRGLVMQALKSFKRLLDQDPWNIAYLTYYLMCLTKSTNESELDEIDISLRQLIKGQEDKVDWTLFDKYTETLESKNYYEICYVRTKISFLFSQGEAEGLLKIVHYARKDNPRSAIFDLMKLLNTNFDQPMISFALGVLHKELWQHESAMMWFDFVLHKKSVSQTEKSQSYLEIADSMSWLNINLDRAEEYARMAMDYKGIKESDQILKILAHIYLRKGKVRQANLCLDQLKNISTFESLYLKGLVQYRNGSKDKAKAIWKPLISQKTNNTRLHYIKQDLLKFYFEEKEYFEIN